MGLPIKITDAGKQAIINAQNTGTGAVLLTQLALGTGNYDPTTAGGRTALVAEFKRIALTSGQVVAADTIHIVAEDTSTDVYTVNEFGIYTNGGVLFAVYSQTAGNITAKTAGAIMLLVADILLTDVSANSVTFGSMEFVNPPASETVQGVAKVATQALVDAGTDDTTILTPKKAKARYADLRGAGFTGRVQINAADDVQTSLIIGGGAKIDTLTLTNALAIGSGGTGATTVTQARSNLGLGSIATQASNSVTITGGSLDGVTIGGTTPGAITGTTITANGIATLKSRVLVNGAVDDNSTALQVAGKISTTDNIRVNNAAGVIQSTAGRNYVTIKGATDAAGVELATGAADADAVMVGLVQFTDRNSTAADKRIATLDAYLSGTTANNRGGYVTIRTKVDGGALAERVRITNAGRILVNTTADNGQDIAQFNGSVSATAFHGTADNATKWAGGNKFVSTAGPSGGADGDVWFQYS